MKKMAVQVDPKVLDEWAKKEITRLERANKSLQGRFGRQTEMVHKLQGGVDISKKRRDHLCELAEALVSELEDAGWAEIDKYYE